MWRYVVVCLLLLVLVLYIKIYTLRFYSYPFENIPEFEYVYVDTNGFRSDSIKLHGHSNASKTGNSHVLPTEGLHTVIDSVQPVLLTDKTREILKHYTEAFFTQERMVMNVDCRAIMRGNKTEILKAEALVDWYKTIEPNEYINMTANCASFIKQRGYITHHMTLTEKHFPIAYSILMFKDLEQSERLLRAIYRPQNQYCIHVDSKSSEDIFIAMTNIVKCFENVFIVGTRINVRWGKMSVLTPELLCMEALWNRTKTWKYFINLTGQEFPLRTNYELVRILKAYNGANDVEGTIERY